MTEYEQRSLQLLSIIAAGIGLTLSSLNDDFQRIHGQTLQENVLDWQKNLNDVLTSLSSRGDSQPET